MTRSALLAALILGASMLPTPGSAQTAEQLVQTAINMDGGDCPQVTYVEGLASITNGNILVGAVCSNGDKWLVEADPERGRVARVFTCPGASAVGMTLPFCEER